MIDGIENYKATYDNETQTIHVKFDWMPPPVLNYIEITFKVEEEIEDIGDPEALFFGL